MLKNDLREKYKILRTKLSARELEAFSISIANNVLKLKIWDYSNYHLFLPIVSQHEVNTEYILQILFGKDKNVIVSKSNFENRTMQHFLLTDSTKIIVNKYGIPEPERGIEIQSSAIDVVFVPLLAYDEQGNRVGYGKGFYDTFFSECKPEVIKIGLSFFEPEPIITDVLPGDVKLDYCVTTQNVHEFR